MEFCKSRVVFITKPQQADYGEAGSFRHISLTQFLFKTMERVVEWSLREHADNFGKISEMQHAYSGTKGTDTALSTLVNMIESSILRKEFCLVVSVDIQGAFDNLATIAIKNVMVDNNYPPLMIRWYSAFFKTENTKCPNREGGFDQIPTTLTDLGTGCDSQFYCDNQEKNLLRVSQSGRWGWGLLLGTAAQIWVFF